MGMWYLSLKITCWTILTLLVAMWENKMPKSRTSTFLHKGSTLLLLTGISKLPASLFLCPGSIRKCNKGDSNTSPATLQQSFWPARGLPLDWQVLSGERSTARSWRKGWSCPGPEQNVTRFYHYLEWHTIKNLSFLLFFILFSDRGWVQVTETAKVELWTKELTVALFPTLSRNRYFTLL